METIQISVRSKYFVTTDVTCGYTFSRKIKLRIFMDVKNILDVKYESVAGYPDTGRLIQGGIKLDFPNQEGRCQII